MIYEENSLSGSKLGNLPSMSGLIAFERSAARLSFAEAGRELNRTPSAISHAIKELEQRLGVVLFERVGRSIRLTDAGSVYLEAVQRIVFSLQIATDRVKRMAEDNVIRLSALPFFTSAILLPNLAEFEERHPEYDLRIETTNGYADILNGEADIGLRFGSQNSKDLMCEPLVPVGGQPVASKSYLSNAPKLDQPQDLNEHTLIHARPNKRAWSEWYRAQTGGELENASQGLSFDSMLGSLDAVRRGLGIGLAMYPLIKSYPGYGVDFVPVLGRPIHLTAEYNFVCKPSAFGDAKIQSVREWLKSALLRLDADEAA